MKQLTERNEEKRSGRSEEKTMRNGVAENKLLSLQAKRRNQLWNEG